jgi:hypothetical protein
VNTKVVDLGWCMARGQKGMITIVSPADFSEGVSVPAQSLVISRKSDLEALQSLVNWVMEQTP